MAIILVLFFLKLQDRRAKPADSILARLRSFDYIGITLTIAWVSCLILAMQFGSSSSKWRSSKVIGLFVGAGLLLIAFFLSQWYQGERSTVPLRVARQRSVLMGALYSFFLEISIYVVSLQPEIQSSIRLIMCTDTLLYPILLPIRPTCFPNS